MLYEDKCFFKVLVIITWYVDMVDGGVYVHN